MHITFPISGIEHFRSRLITFNTLAYPIYAIAATTIIVWLISISAQKSNSLTPPIFNSQQYGWV
jgi:transcriptional regulator of acetoin/glycerol metabolism